MGEGIRGEVRKKQEIVKTIMDSFAISNGKLVPDLIVNDYMLILAEPGDEEKVKDLSGDGQGDLMNWLSKSAVARAERDSYRGRPVDTSYLSRYVGTDFCRWVGRQADGYFHPIGRLMKIVKVAIA